MVNNVPHMPDSNGSTWINNTNSGLDTINANFTVVESQETSLSGGLATVVTEISALNTINNQYGNYTLQTSDNNKTVVVNNATPSTVIVPHTLPVGFVCKITQLGAGIVTVSGDGTLLIYNADGKTGTAKAWASVSVELISANAANLEGYVA